MNRREVLKYLFYTTAAITLYPLSKCSTSANLPALPKDEPAAKLTPVTGAENISSPELLKNVFSRFGFHDAPTPGGSNNISQLLEDFTALDAKTLHSIDPSDDTIERLTREGIKVTARVCQENNKFYMPFLQKTIEKFKRLGLTPTIQAFNEPNLNEENGGKEITPEEHIEEFLKAAGVITAEGGIALFTPLAQDPNDEKYEKEKEYFGQMLDALKSKHLPGSWYKKHFALAFHMYLSHPDENPWQRIQDLYEMTQEKLGIKEIPVYITEAGLYTDENHQYDEKIVAETTLRLLQSQIPDNLVPVIKEVCFWLLANFAQRPEDHQKDPRAQKLEGAAWRTLENGRQILKQVYKRVETYAKEQKKRRQKEAKKTEEVIFLAK